MFGASAPHLMERFVEAKVTALAEKLKSEALESQSARAHSTE
jgi:hypothetical protein